MLPTMISILIEIYMLGGRFTPGAFLHLFCGHTLGLLESDVVLQKILQTVTWQSRKRGLLLGSRWDETRWLYLLLHILDMRSHSPQPERYSGRQAMPKPKPKCLTVSWFHGWFQRRQPRSNSTSFFVFVALFAAGIEADRLLAVEGAKQRKQLKTGFAGIKEAQSANPADKDSWCWKYMMPRHSP